jgi:hypothetical protein
MEQAARNPASKPVMAECAEALVKLALKMYQDAAFRETALNEFTQT